MNRYLSWTTLTFILVSSNARADEESIKSTVLKAQRAGFEDHDFEKYMTQWADEARIVICRSEQPGKYDQVLNREQIEATRRLRFKGKPLVKIRFENVRINVNDDQAVLRVRTKAQFSGGSETVEEVYRLRFTDNGWRVYENRAWPIMSQLGPKVHHFDAREWKTRDAKIEALERTDDPRGLSIALFEAYRFDKAHEVARSFTSEGSPSAADWVLRGQIAVFAGDADDAKASFAKALSLDPNAPLPPYARAKE